MTWTLELPYTRPLLLDNARMSWQHKARITAVLRCCGWALARQAKIPHLERAAIVLHWQPAVRRRRDALSIAPTLKPLIDGIVDAGVLTDDDISRCFPSCRIEPVDKPSRVWLTIEDLGPGGAA